MPNRRPDPDELLVRVREQEARRARGKLKVFFGAAAGVGKTYAMLEAARAQRAAGMDVVAGVVETHHRAETEALLAGVAMLPRKPPSPSSPNAIASRCASWRCATRPSAWTPRCSAIAASTRSTRCGR